MGEIEEQVLAAARDRADALASRDGGRLRRLLHADFHWTSHRGEEFDRERYVSSNTGGKLAWSAQSLSGAEVVVVGDAAVLRCLVTDRVDAGRGTESFRMPMTQTWVRVSGRWLCLAGHAGPRLVD
ncbi:nuclear transport factor 2 family protein [Kribbella sp. VKM Ac-2571]|uniref:nuclear transport factor 2 family protein n=1 Tax=Kribbella sp. VKM Ac-2571 TaxID=2512222 RepID=UPI00105FF529|nr:nuclear transport factor 2 family protein [Kribbella sp. VKM Ac-2571]